MLYNGHYKVMKQEDSKMQRKPKSTVDKSKAAKTRKARKELKEKAFSYNTTTRFFSDWNKNLGRAPRG